MYLINFEVFHDHVDILHLGPSDSVNSHRCQCTQSTKLQSYFVVSYYIELVSVRWIAAQFHPKKAKSCPIKEKKVSGQSVRTSSDICRPWTRITRYTHHQCGAARQIQWHMSPLNTHYKIHHQCGAARQQWNLRKTYLKIQSLKTPSVATGCLAFANWLISFSSLRVQLARTTVMTWQKWKRDLPLPWSSHVGRAVMNWTCATLVVKISMCDFKWPCIASEAITRKVRGSSPIWTCHLLQVRAVQSCTRMPSTQEQRRLPNRLCLNLQENWLPLCPPILFDSIHRTSKHESHDIDKHHLVCVQDSLVITRKTLHLIAV